MSQQHCCLSQATDPSITLTRAALPQPPTVTHYDPLVAQFVCQQFRANKPVTCKLLECIYDPEQNKVCGYTVVRLSP
jgi:hypothetical protein